MNYELRIMSYVQRTPFGELRVSYGLLMPDLHLSVIRNF